MKRTVLRIGRGDVGRGSSDQPALRSLIETTMEITSLILFVAMVGVWALAFGVVI